MASTESISQIPLPIELHAATRDEHAILNRTIIARLPLCLPHATSSPALYAQGMTVIAQIYYGIEEAWDKLLSMDTLTSVQKEMVRQLHIPALRRTQRLNMSLQQLRAGISLEYSAKLDQLQDLSFCFRDEIIQSILAKPHTLMAYTWTMYLALFNGGRWIVRQLLGAGEQFWNDSDQDSIAGGPLSFWFFGENKDYGGDDLKISFKQRFDDAAQSLTAQEREEIILASKRMFAICSEMIALLDQYVQTGGSVSRLQTSTPDVSGSVAQRSTSALVHLASFAPTSMVTLWRSVLSVIPFLPTRLPTPLRQDLEQRQV